MNVILSGGTGFLGTAVRNALIARRHKVILLAREPEKYKDFRQALLQIERWDGKTVGQWKQLMEGADAVVNLAGASIGDGRWTRERKAILLHSRTDPTSALVTAMKQAKHKPAAFINGSAVGYYGDVPSIELVETAPRGSDFLAQLCGEWEKTALEAAELGVRVAIPRFGVVLGKGGGALPRMTLPYHFYAGGWFGSGTQWFPWVHLDDAAEAVCLAVEEKELNGPVNVVAPEVVNAKDFALALGRALDKPCWAAVPAPVLRALLGELGDMLLGGQKVVPLKLKERGFAFKYPDLEPALGSIFPPKKK